MINSDPFLELEQPYDQAVAWVIRQTNDLGLQVVVTFDLQVARHAHTDCSCPHHGTEACDCQLNVLLVYKAGAKPVTLLAHGHDGRTWFSLVNTPMQPADARLEALIRKTLAAPVTASQMERPHAA